VYAAAERLQLVEAPKGEMSLDQAQAFLSLTALDEMGW